MISRRRVEKIKPDVNTMLLLHAEDFSDSSMYKRGNVTNQGASISTDGKFGSAFYFNKQAMLTTPTVMTFGNDVNFTWECWVKFNTLNSHQMIMMQTTNYALGLLYHNTHKKFQIQSIDQKEIVNSNVTPVVGEWYHIALCHKSDSTCSWFINGISQPDAPAYTYPNSRNQLRLGTYDGTVTYGLDGIMDEVRISDVVRYTSNFVPPVTPFST